MMSRQSYILNTANQILSNPEMLRNHMRKSRPCLHGCDCPYDECENAHFMEEYRVPICLYLEFCKKKDCKMYHPHMGSPVDYIKFIGVMLPTREQWEYKKQRDMVHRNAKIFIADKERLREHLMKTRPCFHGDQCKNKEKCVGAHNLEEYRPPVCLFMNFCEDGNCPNFHPHRETKEKFMEEKNIKFAEKKSERQSVILSLKERNDLAMPSKLKNNKVNTQFCNFVKEKSVCSKSGCNFAHSLEELVVNIPYSSMEEKKKLVEKMTGKKVDDVFLRTSVENSAYLQMMKNQVEMIKEICEEEYENKYDEEEDEEDFEEYTVRIDCGKISDLSKWDILGEKKWGDIDEE